MRIVFLDNIKGIGVVGQVKDVSDGYARNFLLPNGLAKPATPEVLKEAEALKAKKLEALKLAHAEAEAVAAKLQGATVTIPGRANEKGTLFAHIGADAIAEAASAAAGAKIAPSQVKLDEPIRTSGAHVVTLQLADGIPASIVVDVRTR
jgi:large subunit ribosomal protein L9